MIALILVTSCSSPRIKNPTYKSVNEVDLSKRIEKEPTDIRSLEDIPQFEETAALMAPGFLFYMGHPSDDKIRGNFRAGPDGELKLPYGVKISVTGLDFAVLRNKVMEAYSKFFQRGSEDITFQLAKREYWVEVRGLVKKSGHYLVDREESLESIISKAGGLRGDLSNGIYIVSLKQQGVSYSIGLNQYYEANGQGKFNWTGGDTIFVNVMGQDSHSQTVPMISVLGGVQKPGNILYKEDATLFYYLNKTGGIIPNLSYEEAYVIRRVDGKLRRINFNLTDMDTVPAMKGGDIIMLNGEKKSWEDRLWERAVQIGSLITSIGILIIAL